MNESIENDIMEEIKYNILELEDQNAKTKNFSYGEMVEQIKWTIIKALKNKNF